MSPFRPNLIFVRLLIIFLFIVLPIFFVGITFINNSIRLQDKLVTNLIEQNLTAEVARITDQMQSLQNTLYYLAGEEDVSILTSRPWDLTDYERAKAINRLQRRLYTLHMSNLHIYKISFVLPAVSKAIHSVSYSVTALQPNSDQEIPATQILSADMLADIAARFQNKSSQFVADANGICYYYRLPGLDSVQKGEVPRLMVEVDYDVNSIGRALRATMPDSDVRYMILDNGGNVLFTNEQQPARQADAKALFADSARHTQLEDRQVHTIRLAGRPYYVLWLPSRLLASNFLFYISQESAIGPSMDHRVWMWTVIGFIVLAVALYGWYAYARVQTPISLLLGGFNRLEQGELDFQVAYRPKDEFHLLVQRFNRMLLRLKSTLAQLYDQKIMTQQAEMKHLQAQINPHFLYNNFYILNNMLLMEDYETASRFCRLLGNYFQYVNKSNQMFAALSDEVRHVRTYVEIQAVRFGASLNVTFEQMPEGMGDPMVPRLILQPILENAFKHALERHTGEKCLHVAFAQTQGQIVITVENNGPAIAQSEIEAIRQALELPVLSRESTGLGNVHQRLKISHGTGIRIRAGALGGLVVEVILNREGPINAI